jgi:cytochrome c oxidase assembly protein subunit 15
MSQISPRGDRVRPVRIWLWIVAALVAATVIVGGATRLTGSGLSITEWRPVTGIVPPLSEAEWQAEFDKYRKIPQFLVLNPDMTLAGFKFIYWWEWAHRALGRLIGLAFIVPFGVFLWRGLIDRPLAWKLGGLFLLGGLQGAIGWWMVSSGLSQRTDVSQCRLAIHLTLACAILVALVALATRLRPHPPLPVRRGVAAGAWGLLCLVLVQIFIGALVAKTGAGLTYNTWPLIDGRFVPPLESLFAMAPLWTNFFENVLTVQFNHRSVAYAIVAVAAWQAFSLQRSAARPVALGAAIVFALAVGQTMLGIVTLLSASPLGLSLAHQAGAVALLVALTVHAARIRPDPARA